jgi:hypothetical protein
VWVVGRSPASGRRCAGGVRLPGHAHRGPGRCGGLSRRRWCDLSAVVAGTVVDPVGVQASSADPALHQSGDLQDMEQGRKDHQAAAEGHEQDLPDPRVVVAGPEESWLLARKSRGCWPGRSVGSPAVTGPRTERPRVCLSAIRPPPGSEHLFTGEYDLVWWIDAANPDLIAAQMLRLAAAAGWAADGSLLGHRLGSEPSPTRQRFVDTALWTPLNDVSAFSAPTTHTHAFQSTTLSTIYARSGTTKEPTDSYRHSTHRERELRTKRQLPRHGGCSSPAPLGSNNDLTPSGQAQSPREEGPCEVMMGRSDNSDLQKPRTSPSASASTQR